MQGLLTNQFAILLLFCPQIVEKLVTVLTWINQTIVKTFGDDNTGAYY